MTNEAEIVVRKPCANAGCCDSAKPGIACNSVKEEDRATKKLKVHIQQPTDSQGESRRESEAGSPAAAREGRDIDTAGASRIAVEGGSLKATEGGENGIAQKQAYEEETKGDINRYGGIARPLLRLGRPRSRLIRRHPTTAPSHPALPSFVLPLRITMQAIQIVR